MEPDRTTGPRLIAALLCDRVLQEADGTLSVIRIVDRVTHTYVGPQPPPEPAEPFILSNVTLFIALRADGALGRYVVRVSPVMPDGTRPELAEAAVEFVPEAVGVNVLMPLNLPVSGTGLAWFEVSIKGGRMRSDRLLTRTPVELARGPGPVQQAQTPAS